MTGRWDDGMAARYARAATLLPAKSGERYAGSGVEGHWVDDERFFYVAGRFDPDCGSIVDEPWIADVATWRRHPVLPPEAVERLLGAQPGWQARARYAMRGGDTLIVTLDDAEHVLDPASQRRLASSPVRPAPEIISPDGLLAVSLLDHGLQVREVATGSLRPLTPAGQDRHAYGRQPESGVSAVSDRRRPAPVGVWSADSRWFLTHRIDERHLGQRSLLEHAPPGGGPPVLHQFAYASPGEELATVELLAIEVATGRMVAAPAFPLILFSPITMHLAWFAGSDRFCHFVTDRYSRTLSLHETNLSTGADRTVVSEAADDGYLDPHPLLASIPNVRLLSGTGELIWYSERDGCGHLYLHDARDGRPVNRITEGDWHVRDIVHVDSVSRTLMFTAGGLDPERDPGMRTLCTIRFDGTGFRRLATDPGDIVVRPAPLDPNAGPELRGGASADGRHVVMRRSDALTGSRTVLLDVATGAELELAWSAADNQAASLRRFMAQAADGLTELHGMMALPSDFAADRSYPLLAFVYPGPQSSFLPRGHGSRVIAQAQALAELGMAVAIVDTRGVPFRCRAVRQAGYGSQLEPQLSDHAHVLAQLCDRYPFLDRTRIGIIGSSGGGAAAARAMLRYPQVFAAGVSVCGNHDSRQYLAGWMEKYVGPGWPDVGDQEANATHASGLEGALLVVTGEMDENVHPAQSLALVDALVRAGRRPECLVVPNEGHLVLLTSELAQLAIWDFLCTHLIGTDPPRRLELAYSAAERRSLAAIGRWESLA